MAIDQNSKLNITLHVYDTNMSVKIDRQDEELYRQSATLISEVVGSYMEYYKGLKSDKEILLMALVDIALRLGREKKTNDTTPYSDILSKLSAEIENALNG